MKKKAIWKSAITLVLAVALVSAVSFLTSCAEISGVAMGKTAEEAGGATMANIKSVYAITVDRLIEVMDPERDYLIVVNEQNAYEFDGDYDNGIRQDLAYMANDVDGDTMAAEKAAYLAYTMLKRDLAADGVKIGIYDGYRTAADQEYLISLLRTPTNPVADTGYTETHTGLLLTVVVWDNETSSWAETLEHEEVSAGFAKLHARAADYGFIVRYPEGKEDVTGLAYRPSNLRFVGLPETAHAIMDNGLTLEEYVAKKRG